MGFLDGLAQAYERKLAEARIAHIKSRWRDQLAGIILEHFRPVDGEWRLNPSAAADAIIEAGFTPRELVQDQQPAGENSDYHRGYSAGWVTGYRRGLAEAVLDG